LDKNIKEYKKLLNKTGIRQTGFFNEHEEFGMYNLKDLPKDIEIEPEIIGYIKDGYIQSAAPHICYDKLSDTKQSLGTHVILTDGDWIWPKYLSYYVEKYKVKIDNDFLQHIRIKNYQMPSTEDIITSLKKRKML